VQSIERSRRSRWESKRDIEIVDTYAGRVELDTAAVSTWFEGLRMLGEVTDRLVCFIHPLNHDNSYHVEADGSNLLLPVLKKLRQDGVFLLLEPQGFKIPESEYLNINHVTPRGSSNLTEQIYRQIKTSSKK